MKKSRTHISVLLIPFLVALILMSKVDNVEHHISNQKVISAAPDPPILISSNDELDLYCGGSAGDALSWDDAYVIENKFFSGTDPAIDIKNTTKYIIIKNVEIDGGAKGIRIENSRNMLLTSLNVSNISEKGIWLSNSQNIEILNSLFIDNNMGIFSFNCSDILLDNNILNSTNAFHLTSCHDVIGINNILYDSIIEVTSSTQIEFGPSNTRFGKPIYVFVGHNKFRIGDVDAGEIYLEDCTQVLIENVKLTSLKETFEIRLSDEIYFRNVSLEIGDSDLVYITESSNIYIQNSSFGKGPYSGISLYDVTNLSIQQCLFYNLSYYGLNIEYLYNFSVSENWFYNITDTAAISLFGAESGEIVDNIYGTVTTPWIVDDGDNLWNDISNNSEVGVYDPYAFPPLELEELDFYYPEILSSPGDATPALGMTNVSLSWTAVPNHPGVYWIAINGNQAVSPNAWDSEPITYVMDISNLPAGDYLIEFCIQDYFGSTTIDHVLITIVDDGGDGDPSNLGLIIGLSIAGAGVVGVTIFLIIRKKKKKD